MNYVDDIADHGFSIVQEFLDSKTITRVLEVLANTNIDDGASQRGKSVRHQKSVQCSSLHARIGEQLRM